MKMFPLLILTALSLMSQKCSGVKSFLVCDSDKDCEKGFSCIENNCKICVKCSLIFRKGNTCESDFNQCGDCLEGYKEISVTVNSAVKKPCKPIMKERRLKECVEHSDCPPNNHCSEMSCVKCFDCSLINRLEAKKCAKGPNECGPCLMGYLLIHDTSRSNHKCEKGPPDHMPFGIPSGSVLTAVLFAVVCFIILLGIYFLRDFIQSVVGSPTEKGNNVNESQTEEYPMKNVQILEFYQLPSESDSAQDDNSHEQDRPANAQRLGRNLSPSTVICMESAERVNRSVSEVNSISSSPDSQEEQPVEMNVLNNDSAENNSHLVTEDPAQVPGAEAKEPTEDLPPDQEQV